MSQVSHIVENLYNKIQLCVCFPSTDYLTLTLNYKENPESADKIEIVSLTVPTENYQEDKEFINLNKLYNFFIILQQEPNFSIKKSSENNVKNIEILGIDDNTINKNSVYYDKNTTLNALNLYINDIINIIYLKSIQLSINKPPLIKNNGMKDITNPRGGKRQSMRTTKKQRRQRTRQGKSRRA